MMMRIVKNDDWIELNSDCNKKADVWISPNGNWIELNDDWIGRISHEAVALSCHLLSW
jgi:hypothetical protein